MNSVNPGPGPEEGAPTRKRLVTGLIILAVLLVFTLTVMLVNSIKPDRLAVEGIDSKVEGSAFVSTNQALIRQMRDNWLPNDLYWPTVFLDNMPNFQIGQLEVVRYNVRELRDNLSRMRTTDKLDVNAEAAFTSLSNDPYKWWFPSAESKWENAEKELGVFLENLKRGSANFYPRADNLVELLNQYASLMGGVNTRLINAPGDLQQTLTAADDAKTAAPGAMLVDIDIPWHKVDDNFYYAQGVAYALYESFKAVRVEFMDVLMDKNSVKMVDKILESLGRCDFEPLLVMNGDPDSIFANHSLNLSGMFNDARQKVQSLIVALKQG